MVDQLREYALTFFSITVHEDSMLHGNITDNRNSATCALLMKYQTLHKLYWAHPGTIAADSDPRLVGRWNTQLRTFTLVIIYCRSCCDYKLIQLYFYHYRVLCSKILLISSMDYIWEVLNTRLEICYIMYTYTNYKPDIVLQGNNHESTQTTYRRLTLLYHNYMTAKKWKPASYAHASERYPTTNIYTGFSWQYNIILTTLRLVLMTIHHSIRLNYGFTQTSTRTKWRSKSWDFHVTNHLS